MTTIERSRVVQEILRLFPPMVRDGLLGRPAFLDEHGLRLDARITFGNGSPSFRRSTLFTAIREAYSSGSAHPITDDAGTSYDLSIDVLADAVRLEQLSAARAITLPSFWFLKASPEARLASFDGEVDQLHVTGPIVAEWRKRVEVGISDDEVDGLLQMLKLTPEQVSEAIARELGLGSSNVSTFVPPHRMYFVQLIGETESIDSLTKYVEQVLPALLADIGSSDQALSLSRSLLLCSHSSISEAVPQPEITEQLLQEFEQIAVSGDLVSQVGAVEIGLRIIHLDRRLEEPLLTLVRTIAQKSPSEGSDRYKLTSSLIILVDGELSRLSLFRSRPPFLRRLAAIAQASLIERVLIAAEIDGDHFADWATSGRGQRFFLQSLVDLREEPRWLPDFMSPEQLRFELLSRLVGAADRHKAKIPEGDLKNLLLGDGESSLRSQMTFPFSYIPGPLEGGQESPVALPDSLVEDLRAVQLADTVEATSFAALVNSSLVFRIEVEHTKLVVELLRRVKHQVAKLEEDSKIFNLLTGLAVAAATARDSELAAEVRVLARILRRRPGVVIEPASLMRIGLIASASERSLPEWCDAVGQWLTELSYDDLGAELSKEMHSHLQQLCAIVPDLWRTCSRAESAFSAASRLAA